MHCKPSIHCTYQLPITEPEPVCPKCLSNLNVKKIERDFTDLRQDQLTHYCTACRESFCQAYPERRVDVMDYGLRRLGPKRLVRNLMKTVVKLTEKNMIMIHLTHRGADNELRKKSESFNKLHAYCLTLEKEILRRLKKQKEEKPRGK